MFLPLAVLFIPNPIKATIDTSKTQLGSVCQSTDSPFRTLKQPARYQGIIVDSVVIENRDIYDTDSERYRLFVFKLANRLHYKTRQSVIKREILIKAGEKFSPELAEETARNLRHRLSIFDAWVETQILPNGHLLVKIVTIDEWSLSGGINISREGNETKYGLSATERNLLGNNQFLSLKYILQSSDDNYIVARFADNRFLGYPYAVQLGYGDDPLGRFRRISFGHPFYNLLQPFSFDFSVATTSGRREIYSGSRLIGKSQNEGDRTAIYGAYRFGSYKRKIQFNSQYVYRYERSFDKTIAATNKNDSLLAKAVFPSDSLYHQVGVGIRMSNLGFVALTQIDGYGYTEDFVLGQAIQIGFARALTSDFRDYVFDVVDIGFSQGFYLGSNLALFSYHRGFWLHEGRDIRRVTKLSANYYNSSLQFLTIAARGICLSDSRVGGAEALTVGGGDIRGFDKVFLTGDRKMVFNFEGRFYPKFEIMSVFFRPIVFADLARTWKSNEVFKFRDFYMSSGIGLRLALERSSKSWMLRIDLAYSDINRWQLSIGTNQYFKAQPSSFLLTTH